MASYLIRLPASDHAAMVRELREAQTCHGQPIRSWSEQLVNDGRDLQLKVVYETLSAGETSGTVWLRSPERIECYQFSAANVRALEGK